MQMHRIAAVLGMALADAIAGSVTVLMAQEPEEPTAENLDVFDEPCVARRAQEIINLGTPGATGGTNAFAPRTASVGPDFVSLSYRNDKGVVTANGIATPDGNAYGNVVPAVSGSGALVQWRICGRYSSAAREACNGVTGEALAVEASQAALARARILSATEGKCMVRINAARWIGQHIASSRNLNGDILSVLREIRDQRAGSTPPPVGGLPGSGTGAATR